MELHLILKTFSIFMVTYLPTILMNIINQATNYIRGEDRYQIILELNITSLMVLASIYLSVSNGLPGSSNIKPVEIWLLFNLAYPFLVIIVNILIQYFEKPSAPRRNTKVAVKTKKEIQSYEKIIHINIIILKVISQFINPLVYTIFSVVYLFVYY